MAEPQKFSFENSYYKLDFSPDLNTFTLSVRRDADGRFHRFAEQIVCGAKILHLTHGEILVRPEALISLEEKEGETVLGKHKVSSFLFSTSPDKSIKLRFTLELYHDSPYFLADAAVENHSSGPVLVKEISAFLLSSENGGALHLGSPDEIRFFKNGWQSWSPTLSLSLSEKDLVQRTRVFRRVHQYDENYKPKKSGMFVSEGVTALKDTKTRRVFVLGFVTFTRQFTQICINAQKRGELNIAALSYAEHKALNPGESLLSEKLFAHFSNENETDALNLYAETLQKLNDVKITKEMPTGWCTWYYYFRNIYEDEVLKNLKRLQSIRDDVPVKLFQIDDGYQNAVGDWLVTNNKFPSGMKACADKIKEAGFMPGLWLAPFVVTRGSAVWREHPDWLLRDARGKPVIAGVNPLWEGWAYYSLDTTHPEALAWLKTVFHTVCQEWGYKFIKIDFIFGAAVEGVRYNKNVTRCEAYRMGLAAVREGAGDDTFILGCGAPLYPSIGIVDGMRIGMDVDPTWIHPTGKLVGDFFTLSARNAILNTLTRSFMQRHFWHNDPDCLLVRDTKTHLTENEVNMLTAVISLSGGMLLTSDNLLELSPPRQQLLSKIFPPLNGAGMTIGLCDATLPPAMMFRVNEDEYLVAAFMWEARSPSFQLNLKDYGVEEGEYLCVDALNGRFSGFVRAQMSCVMEGRGVKLFLLRKYKGNPCVLWTDAHITGGAHLIKDESYNKERQQLYFKINAGKAFHNKIYVHVPGFLKLRSVQSSTNSMVNPHPSHEELLELSCDFKNSADFTLTFE